MRPCRQRKVFDVVVKRWHGVNTTFIPKPLLHMNSLYIQIDESNHTTFGRLSTSTLRESTDEIFNESLRTSLDESKVKIVRLSSVHCNVVRRYEDIFIVVPPHHRMFSQVLNAWRSPTLKVTELDRWVTRIRSRLARM